METSAQPSAGGSADGVSVRREPTVLVDRFDGDVPAGRVVGNATVDGIVRGGIDTERIIGIDNGALRIQPLTKPGWGRAGLAYGPYRRQNGLAFGAFLLNGHNISRVQPLPEGFRMRVGRWVVGSETDPPFARMLRALRGRQRRFVWRRLLQWFRTGTHFFEVPHIEENLAVGWFRREAPKDPLQEGNALIVHAVVPEGGELWARVGATTVRTIRGIQNIPIYYLVVLRESGAAYYVASIPGARGLAAVPTMRPVAIDAFAVDQSVYAGIHQSVIGEIGFRLDTRVYAAWVGALDGFGAWFGSAHAADRFVGGGALSASAAEIGGHWEVHEGDFIRTDRGLAGRAARNAALIAPRLPSGLVHVLIDVSNDPVDRVSVLWRVQDERNFWCFEVGRQQCQLSLTQDGRLFQFPATKDCRLLADNINSVQVVDDGEHLRVYLNTTLAYGTTFADARLSDGTRVGVRVDGGQGDLLVRSFEAHPREIAIPPAFHAGAGGLEAGDSIVVRDEFDGPAGDLAGHTTTAGDRQWQREIGRGQICLSGQSSARVVASVEQPCPGRTAYTIPWHNSTFADMEVTVTAPPLQRGKKVKGRGGLIFVQDADTYILVNLWNDAELFSISSFFRVDGYEELYDAAWTNIGARVQLGEPFNLRVICDGKRYLACVNGEPVLYRALSDIYPDWDNLAINRVGIVVNWEWGNDTGSVFRDFVAKDRGTSAAPHVARNS
jgi:hypothetical protein